MGSFDEDEEWEQCHRCGWWGYLGEDVPDKFRLCWEFVPDDCISGDDILLCMRCEEAENWQECRRIHFRYCVGVKGFDRNDHFQCTKCGEWGCFAKRPNLHLLRVVPDDEHGFELLCPRCV